MKVWVRQEFHFFSHLFWTINFLCFSECQGFWQLLWNVNCRVLLGTHIHCHSACSTWRNLSESKCIHCPYWNLYEFARKLLCRMMGNSRISSFSSSAMLTLQIRKIRIMCLIYTKYMFLFLFFFSISKFRNKFYWEMHRKASWHLEYGGLIADSMVLRTCKHISLVKCQKDSNQNEAFKH